ncbi:hypothetical protein B0F90DRAFT_1772695, partial [Multifurca ochricompacta]
CGREGGSDQIRLHLYNYASWKDVLEFSAKHAIVTEVYGSLANDKRGFFFIWKSYFNISWWTHRPHTR